MIASEETQLDQTVAVFRHWLALADSTPLLAVLAAVAANRLQGDPVWFLLVGAPSSGKSEIIQSLVSLPEAHETATITSDAALLSGSPKREKAPDAKGGLLAEVGDHGLLVVKDFGSILTLYHEQRGKVLQALREVYDGKWVRSVGADGGRKLPWAGKVGLIGGCTQAIDRHQGTMAMMGERFVMHRIAQADALGQGRTAMKHAKRSKQMRTELAEAVAALFKRPPGEPPEDGQTEERLVKLAVLVVRCRSAVERDSYTREIEVIPDAEGPGRLVIVLDRLMAGLLALGADRDTAWGVVQAVALDSIPALRRKLIEVLLTAVGEMPTADIAKAIDYPTRTTERGLEDLTAHRIVAANRSGSGRKTAWQISHWAKENWASATSPEKSNHVSPNSSCTHTIDFPGEVGGATSADGSANPQPDSLTAAVGANVSNSDDGNASADGGATPLEQLGEPPDGWTWEELEGIAETQRAEEGERTG
jgi:hypothetical protein